MHHLTKSLACKGSGLPKNAKAIAILPYVQVTFHPERPLLSVCVCVRVFVVRSWTRQPTVPQCRRPTLPTGRPQKNWLSKPPLQHDHCNFTSNATYLNRKLLEWAVDPSTISGNGVLVTVETTAGKTSYGTA